jgi:hypothetical protein
MKKLFFLFFIACGFAQAQHKPVSHTQPAAQPAPAQAKPAVQAALQWCRLGVDPVDATRQPQWDSECIVKVPTTPVVMATGSGQQVRCLLPPLTPVVIDRKNGKALWVLQCGNPIVEPVFADRNSPLSRPSHRRRRPPHRKRQSRLLRCG